MQPSPPSVSVPQQVGHGKLLPQEYVDKVPAADAQILDFLLTFLDAEGLPSVPIFVNGGYVRDLLLGKVPDDLDLSFCLRDCPEEVTVGALLEKVPAFAAAHGEFGIVQVKLATCLSDESKNKNLDTFKAHFTTTDEKKIEVDVMPTIGEESYDAESRIPVRDERGTAEQDTLRRDLTIGAMLLRVGRVAAASETRSVQLSFELLDFYNGLGDLQAGVLRSPCPRGASLADVKSRVLVAIPAELVAAAGVDGMNEEEAIQVLWWAKVLTDDPLRISRALRFAAKFGFALHETFWFALPFALQPLRTKVAGERKVQEYMKIASYGFRACSDFYKLAFSRCFSPGMSQRAAPALFGGQDEKRRVRGLSDVSAFNSGLFDELVRHLDGLRDAAELLGGMLAAAAFASEFSGARRSVCEEFTEACGGMCVSNAMREAGAMPLQALDNLSAPTPEPSRLDAAFAAACGLPAEALCLHVQAWNALRLPNHRNADEGVTARRRQMVLRMLEHANPQRSAAMVASVEAILLPRPSVKGSILSLPGLLEVPGPLRQQIMVLLEVSLRLLHYSEPLESEAQVRQLLEVHPALCGALSSSLWLQEDGRTLRDEFNPRKSKVAKKG